MRVRRALAGGVVATLAMGAALSSAGCSLAFGGSRYMGGSVEDAPSLDAGPRADAFLDPTLDAFGLDAFVVPVDAVVPGDQGPIGCTDSASCPDGAFCDVPRSLCVPCDPDGDGVPRRECSPALYDCDDATGFVARDRTLASAYSHSLRVFGGRELVHVLYAAGDGEVHYVTVGATASTLDDRALSWNHAPGALDYDAVRVDRDLVVIAGYTSAQFHRLDLSGDSLGSVVTRDFSSLASAGFPSLVAHGSPVILEADASSVYLVGDVTFGSPTSVTERLVVDVGGSRGGVFSVGSHVAELSTYAGFTSGPTASALGAALLPNAASAGSPFELSTGDVRPSSENVGFAEFAPSDLPVGQLAITRLADRAHIVALAALAGTPVHLEEIVLSCTGGSYTCVPDRLVRTTVSGMAQTTVAVAALSSHDLLVVTSDGAGFRLGAADLCVAGACSWRVPDTIDTVGLPTSELSASAVAVDLVAGTAPGRFDLTLARVGDGVVQTLRGEICAPAD